ncbi:uncharacterized protein PHALS_05141 [Plasmopara halstedii]|uniref:Uncharacterized protein n=1 Tax=Plasmopara halstedii TaxID=4781 RepID=A0A0P1AZE7_PLAHL|nr:uncharacterized protein PHALS_05141 [Plasmopara halstedii]CEG47807.1 hypothetical protein PHALS_05141 [Plasmopara halstedii]|eukprot:XP_024584176.1 hypothetical protein PHALS_05141 [Plasmopara halstedii]
MVRHQSGAGSIGEFRELNVKLNLYNAANLRKLLNVRGLERGDELQNIIAKLSREDSHH